jgi:hypothetical protein
MKKIFKVFSSLAFLLGGCTGLTTEDYKGKTPALDIRKFLNGPVEAWGILYDYTGKADVNFHVTMVGSWTGNTGVLDEHFVFSDGRKDHRVWTINFKDDHHFKATAHDVVGEAEGSQNGNVVNMKYVLTVPREGGSSIDLNMDDWMYLIDDKTLINRTKMKKFGLTVGELVIAFRKN